MLTHRMVRRRIECDNQLHTDWADYRATHNPTPSQEFCTEIVRRIQESDQDAEALGDLYNLINRRSYGLARLNGSQDRADIVNSVWILTREKIRNNEIHTYGLLYTFVTSMLAKVEQAQYVRRQRRQHLLNTFHARDTEGFTMDPEYFITLKERVAAALAACDQLGRDILIRFYLKEETKEEICAALGISETTFRLKKSRTLAALKVSMGETPAVAA